MCLNILLVDDNRMFCLVAGRSLEEAGFNVATLNPGSAFDVLKACVEHRADVVVLDYGLPTCSAETLTIILKEDTKFNGVKVLGISSTRDAAVAARMRGYGADDFICKGSMNHLVEAARRLCLEPLGAAPVRK